MGTTLQDIRHSIRQLMRKPVFTATAVLTLAVGMGVNAVAFSVVNGFLFKSYALSGIAGVGRLATTPGGDESGYASLAEYARFAEATSGTLDLAAEGRSSIAWKHGGGAETAWVLYVSRRYFSIVQPPMVAGRLLVDREGSTLSAVIGERFWRDKLGAPSLAGLTLRLNHTDVSVAGVVAGSFTGPAGIYSPDIWLPLEDLPLFGQPPVLQQRDSRWLFLLGRLLDGATPAEVDGQVQAAVAGMKREWPDTHGERGATFRMLDGTSNSEVRAVATGAALGMGVIGLVLLLACFNVANLLLARAVERERDMAVRSALGAKPSRLMRLVVTEGSVIAILSGVLALVLARWTQVLVGSFAIPIEQPQHIDLAPDATVVLFIGALMLVAGVLPGVWPALSAARVDVLRVLGSQGANAAGARPTRMRRWLVGAQIAGSTMFLAVSGLFVQSYGNLATLDVGFARDRLVLADFQPASHGFDGTQSERFVTAFADRVGALPGIAGTALVTRPPFSVGFDTMTMVWPPGQSCGAGGCQSFPTYAVSPGYFRTMGIGLVEGRDLDAARPAGEVVITTAMATLLFPNDSAVGKTLRVGDAGDSVTVVGVTERTRTMGLDRERRALYIPMAPPHFARPLTIVARTEGPPASSIRAVTAAASAVDPDVAMSAVKTMEERMAVQLWPFRTLSWFFGICAGLALVLATVGLAGVVIHAANRRVREFGVRLSVGATRRDLIVEVLRGSTRLLVPGLAIGLLLAAGIAQLVRFLFVGVDVLNPLTYLVVAAVQAAIVVAACIGPAIRASRVDPLAALRAE